VYGDREITGSRFNYYTAKYTIHEVDKPLVTPSPSVA